MEIPSNFARLGIEPVINCGAVRTFYGNTATLPEVIEAMAEAAQCHILMEELRVAISARLAELTGFEAGLVTCGSAGGLFLAAAACAAGNDPEKMLSLPQVRGARKVALMPTGHRFSYDHAFRLAGLEIIEAASVDGAAALLKTGVVALIGILGTRGESGPLPFAELAALGADHGVPVVVDAASEFLARPSRWSDGRTDLVVYSSGKFMRGPQASGLLLGRRDLIEAAWRNASPQQAAGRAMKVGKDQMLGALVAVEQWFAQGKMKSERERCYAYLMEVAAGIEAALPLRTEIFESSDWPVPRLRISWEGVPETPHASALRAALLRSDPRVLIDDIGMADASVVIDAFSLRREDCEIVSGKIVEFFRTVRHDKTGGDNAREAIDLSGSWDVHIEFLLNPTAHRFFIEKVGDQYSGIHSGGVFEAPLEIEAGIDWVSFASKAAFEGVYLYYSFTGKPVADYLEGEVVLGAGSAANSGPVGASQFGRARWRAKRISHPA